MPSPPDDAIENTPRTPARGIGLRVRLALLVLVAGLPAALLFWQHTREEHAALVASAEGRALRLARIWAENHDALIREASLILRAAVRDPAVAQLARDRGAAAAGGGADGCADALRTLTRQANWTSALAIVRRNGTAVCTADPADREKLNPIDAGFLDDVFENAAPQVSEFRLDAAGGSTAFVGLRLHPDPAAAGSGGFAVLAAVDLTAIQARTAREAEGAQYNLMVIDRRGIILARDLEAAGFVGTWLGDEHPLMPRIGAKVAIGLSRADVLGGREREADRLLALLLAIAAAAAAAAWMLAEISVLRGLGALIGAANRIARGDLTARAAVPATVAAEFRALGTAFNRMAGQLAVRQDEVEARSAALAASERRFRAAAAAAEAANRAKSEFLATMSHELRTPLNAIIGFSEILANEMHGPLGSPSYRGYVADVLASGRHLLAIINDILDIAKAEAGRLELIEDGTDIARIAADVVRLLGPTAGRGSVTLTADGLPPELTVLGDERRLRQILLNLIGNAVKFTPEGGAVRVGAGRTGDGGMRVTVADSGIGMTEAELAQAGQPFWQADGRLARRHEGTGLGLAVARRLAELHGGAIRLASAPGEGTVATLLLPPERAVVSAPAGSPHPRRVAG